jgi:DNA-binding GntR family transcriptional regulator
MANTSPAVEQPAVPPPSVVFKTKEEQVAEFIREGIMSGLFPRGQKLKQAELAKMLNLSITPVREALKLLEAEGYVAGASHRGAIVAPFEADQLPELSELRQMLETRLVRLAIGNVTPEVTAELRQFNAEIKAAAEREDWVGVRKGNYRLHFRFYTLAGQPQTLHFVRVLWAKYPFGLLGAMPPRVEAVIDEHEQVLEALEAGNREAACELMCAHIAQGQRVFTRRFEAAQQGTQLLDLSQV